jgi:S-DNA-T family DNA segregation ATPase FtsK/SpoIIIE
VELIALKQEGAKEEEAGRIHEHTKSWSCLPVGLPPLIQRRLRVGYPGRLMIEQMEADGLVGAAGRDGRREVVGRRGPVGAEEA